MDKQGFLYRTLRASLGLVIFIFGDFLIIQANIGMSPWTSFAVGLSHHIPLTYGQCSFLISLIVMALAMDMKEQIGWGTILDAFICGIFLDIFVFTQPLPMIHDKVFVSLVYIFFGLMCMAIGQWLYMSAAMCCGPRDSLLVALGKRVPGMPIGQVEMAYLGTVLMLAILLGGHVGLGTLLVVFGAGAFLDKVCDIVAFEPRDVQHDHLLDTLQKRKTS